MEINSGLWQGLSFDEIAEKYPSTYLGWKNDIGHATPDGGETCAQLYDRATAFLQEIVNTGDETVCLVCHATPIRMMESYISGVSAQDISWVPNASVTVYGYDGVFHLIERGTSDFLGDLQTNLPKNI